MTTETSNPRTGAQPVVVEASDPARRPDVLFRVRRKPGTEMSAWWPIGAFVGVSLAAIALLNLVPGTGS